MSPKSPENHSPAVDPEVAKDKGPEAAEKPAEKEKRPFGERLSALKEKAKASLGKYMLGRFSKEELTREEQIIEGKSELTDLKKQEADLVEKMKEAKTPEEQEELTAQLGWIRESYQESRDRLNETQGGAKKALAKGLLKGLVSTAATIGGVKFFPDALRYALQRREISKERGALKETLETDTEKVKTDFELKYEGLVERVKESKYMGVEKRNQLLKRLEAVKADREAKHKDAGKVLVERIAAVKIDALMGDSSSEFYQVKKEKLKEEKEKLMKKEGANEAQAEAEAEKTADAFAREKAGAYVLKQLETDEGQKAFSEAEKQEHEKIEAETLAKIRAGIDQHVVTQVRGTEVAKQLINTVAMASGFGILRTVGYAGAAVVERYKRIKGEKAAEQGVAEQEAKVGVMREVFLNGFTETAKELAFMGGKTKTERAVRFAKALGVTARAAGLLGIAGGEILGAGSVSAAFERTADTWKNVWDQSDGAADTMKNVAEQMVMNGAKNVENMASFYKKVFSGEIWQRAAGGTVGAVEAHPSGAAREIVGQGAEQAIEAPPAAPVELGPSKEMIEMATIHRGEHDSASAIARDFIERNAREHGLRANFKSDAEFEKWTEKAAGKWVREVGLYGRDNQGNIMDHRFKEGAVVMPTEFDESGVPHGIFKKAEGLETVVQSTTFQPDVIEATAQPEYPQTSDEALKILEKGGPDAEAVRARILQSISAADRDPEFLGQVESSLKNRFQQLEWAMKTKELVEISEVVEKGKISDAQASVLAEMVAEGSFSEAQRGMLSEIIKSRDLSPAQIEALKAITGSLRERVIGLDRALAGKEMDVLLNESMDDLKKKQDAFFSVFVKERPTAEVPDLSTGRMPVTPRPDIIPNVPAAGTEALRVSGEHPLPVAALEAHEQSAPVAVEIKGNAADLMRENDIHIEGKTIEVGHHRYVLGEQNGVTTQRVEVMRAGAVGSHDVYVRTFNSDGSMETIRVHDGDVLSEVHMNAAELKNLGKMGILPHTERLKDLTGAGATEGAEAVEGTAGQHVENIGAPISAEVLRVKADLPPELAASIAEASRNVDPRQQGNLIKELGVLWAEKSNHKIMTELSGEGLKSVIEKFSLPENRRFGLNQLILGQTWIERAHGDATAREVLKKSLLEALSRSHTGGAVRVEMPDGHAFDIPHPEDYNSRRAAQWALRELGVKLEAGKTLGLDAQAAAAAHVGPSTEVQGQGTGAGAEDFVRRSNAAAEEISKARPQHLPEQRVTGTVSGEPGAAVIEQRAQFVSVDAYREQVLDPKSNEAVMRLSSLDRTRFMNGMRDLASKDAQLHGLEAQGQGSGAQAETLRKSIALGKRNISRLLKGEFFKE